MVKYFYILAIGVLLGFNSWAKSFNRLDYKNYFTTEYIAKQTEYVAVNLTINLQKSDVKNIVLKVFYIWDKDSIIEYFPINAIASKTLKHIQVQKGNKLNVGIQVVGNANLEKVSGDIDIKAANVKDTITQNAVNLVGGYIITNNEGYNFEIKVDEITSNKMVFEFITNENFNEDKLHVQITYSMPSGNSGVEKKSLDVNLGNYLTFDKKKHTLSFSNFIKQSGVYSFKIEFLNNTHILNGVSEISVYPDNQ